MAPRPWVPRCLTMFVHETFGSFANYHNCFFKSTGFVTGLAIAQKYVKYGVVGLLITFFTDTLVGIDLRQASLLTNLQEMIFGVMLIIMSYVSGSPVSDHKVILYSSAAYIAGLGMLALGAYNLIPQGKLGLYYSFAVLILAIGRAGSQPILENFYQDQLHTYEHDENEKGNHRVEARFKVWKIVVWIGTIFPLVFIGRYGWQKTLVIAASMMTAGTLCFLLGTLIYPLTNPIITPIITVFHVLKVSLKKRHLDYPNTPTKFFHNKDNELVLKPRVPCFRWLDKAAIIDTSSLDPEAVSMKIEDLEEKAEGKLSDKICTVRQVKETKLLLRMFPVWATFIGFGLVEVTGHTFFPEQGKNMNPKFSISALLVLRALTKVVTAHVFDYLAKRFARPQRKPIMIFRIWLGMVVYTISFVLARNVEIRKLSIVKENNLQDQRDAIVDLSRWSLLPQFCLLGCAAGLAMDGLARFYDFQVPKSMKSHGNVLIDGLITGFGSMFSIICVRIFSKWFGDSLNTSRLDKYFFFIIIVSIANSVVCSVVLLLYPFNKIVKPPKPCKEMKGVVELSDTKGEELQVQNKG